MDDQVPVLNHENYIVVVRHILDWYSGANYGNAIVQTRQFYAENDPDTSELVSTNPVHWQYVYACELPGGSAVVDIVFPENTGIVREYDLVFDACDWNSARYDGSSRYTVSSLGNEIWQHEGLTVTDADGLVTTVTGTVRESFSGCGYGDYQEWAVESVNYTEGGNVVTTELSAVNTHFGYGADCAQNRAVLGGSFTLVSPVTSGNLLDIDTPLIFENTGSSDRLFQAGNLRIRAADGSRIELNADNGESRSVTVSITIDGATDNFSEPWSTWQDSLVLDLDKGG
ncbi:MAG: hypothetical protein HKN42_07505 [Granulosicoccus sp.]|nr:hypothetical protein [Granulosicoccus sp.]